MRYRNNDALVCIDDAFHPESIKRIPNRPVKDEAYTVRDVIRMANGRMGLLLHEITNPLLKDEVTGFEFEPSFAARRFAKLDDMPDAEELLEAVNEEVEVLVEVG